ncbi:Hypothetical predicted protein [Cloeon dipterum]|uniref:Uncharacterized protein n=1 Tax=Cloeon dipterum TaxID=197152 RepID=A0A8S1DYS4_9INSE|nr:Hypothetical predicted protein [Cloeon dipterum]
MIISTNTTPDIQRFVQQTHPRRLKKTTHLGTKFKFFKSFYVAGSIEGAFEYSARREMSQVELRDYMMTNHRRAMPEFEIFKPMPMVTTGNRHSYNPWEAV